MKFRFHGGEVLKITIRCKKCKRFAKLLDFKINALTENIRNVRVDCKFCGKIQEAEYDCYEDIMGYNGDINDNLEENIDGEEV